MKKILYYIKTNAYNIVASVPEDPEDPAVFIYNLDEIYDALIDPATNQELEKEDQPAAAAKFLAGIEDDSSWEEEEDGEIRDLIEICDDYRIIDCPTILATLAVDYL